MPATDQGTLDRSWEEAQDSSASPSLSTSPVISSIKIPDVMRVNDGIPRGEESKRRQEATWRSLPTKDKHEKFLRDFIDVVIEKAVFEVSFILYIDS